MDELIKQLLCYLKVTGRMFLRYWEKFEFLKVKAFHLILWKVMKIKKKLITG
jgi:hypothetical protein